MANDHCYFSMIGRLTRDCELNYTSSGNPVVKFSIAVNTKISKEKEYVSFFECVLWGQFGVALEKFLTKGKRVHVEGRPKQERWNDKNTGNTRSKISFTIKDLQLLSPQNQQKSINNNGTYIHDPWAEEDPYKE